MFKKFFNKVVNFIFIGGEHADTKVYCARIAIAGISTVATAIMATIKHKFAPFMILLHCLICGWAVH